MQSLLARGCKTAPGHQQQQQQHQAHRHLVPPQTALATTRQQQLQPVAATASWQQQLPRDWQQQCRQQHQQQQHKQHQQQHLHRHARGVLAVQAGPPEQLSDAASKKRLAVFVSGGGSNFKAIHTACLKGAINAEVVAVVSDVPSCGGVKYAQEQGIATLTYPASKKGLFPGLTAEELVQQLTGEQLAADYVLLAGYLKLIPVELVRAFKRRMLNIHPGLLPSFGGKGYYGERVHHAVLASGARFSGPTVHFVDAEYDTGPILAQRVVPVYPTDTPKQLAARVLEQEHQVYPYAVSALVDGRITWREDGIPIIWEAR